MQTEACGCGLTPALVAMLKSEDSDCQAAAAALLHTLAAATQNSRYCFCNFNTASCMRHLYGPTVVVWSPFQGQRCIVTPTRHAQSAVQDSSKAARQLKSTVA